MGKFTKRIYITALSFVLFIGWTGESVAQIGMGSGSGGSGAYALEEGERNLKFAAIPIPNYSEVLGFSLGAVGMAYYKLDRHDDNLPPSSTGIFGFFSENNSWIGAAFQTIHYDEDKWRGTLAFGTGSVKYQFNPASLNPGMPDVFLNYTTATDFAYLAGSRQTWQNLYLGLEFVSWSAQVGVDPDLIEIPKERYTGPGLTAEWDARDHIMYPTRGFKVNGGCIFYDETFGADRDFQKLKLIATGYKALGDSTRVLAGRVLSESAFGDVPFSGQSILSGNRNLRGYADGRHRGDSLLVMEAEYRWNFWGKWGAAAFTGVAFVARDLQEMALSDALPAAGFGLRYRMIESYRINARVDVGWGKDDHGIYFSIGEAY